MQTADLQSRTSVRQTSTWVSQTSTPVSQTSTLVRLFRLAISDGNGNMIYNLLVCKSAVCKCCTLPRMGLEPRSIHLKASMHA